MGVDLVDFYRGKVSLRKLCVFINCLTEDSLVLTELHSRENDGEGAWNTPTLLGVQTINLLLAIKHYQEIMLWQRSGGSDSEKPEPPDLIKQPGWKPEKIQMSEPLEIRAFMEAMGQVF